ncbi:hypothetical protein SUDANB121_01312 [Nocardiopsis dassonvillei]
MVEATTSAQKEMRELDALVRKRVVRAIAELAKDPCPDDCKKLKARDVYRIRIGDHRVIYAIDDGTALPHVGIESSRHNLMLCGS